MKIIGVLASVAIIAVLVISQMTGSGGATTPVQMRAAADEGSAIVSIRLIHTAQTKQRMSKGAFAQSLDELAATGFIDPVLGSGKKAGYRFEVRGGGDDAFVAIAWPEVQGKTGERWFYVDQTGTIRYTRGGSEPDASSAGLGGN